MENRLSKILAKAGVASRRACERLIFDGKVTVNGQKVLLPQHHVSINRDVICVEGRKIAKVEPKVYYMLNKPKGTICSNRPSKNYARVVELFAHEVSYRLFTVGRLDKDTTGLLIVTNDGAFAQKVIHPRANLEKEYLVKTDREITHDDLVRIGKGGMVDGAFVRPKKVTKVRKGTVKVVVKEGRKREVRCLVEKTGMEVKELKRIRIGGLLLQGLPEGSWRPLTEQEIKLLLQEKSEKVISKPVQTKK